MDSNGNGLFRTGEQKQLRKLLISKYLPYWYWFVICVFLAFLVANLHFRYNTIPEYYVSGTLLIKENNKSGLSGQIGDLNPNKTLGNEMVILRSRNLMYRVLSELSLNTSYFIEGRFRDVEVFQEDLPISLIIGRMDSTAFGKKIKLRFLDNNNFNLIEYDKNGEEITSNHKFGKEITKPYASFTVIANSDTKSSKDLIIKFQNVGRLADRYSRKLSIYLESKDANVLRLELTDAVPQRSIMILNKLVEVYNKETMEDKAQVGISSINFLDERIAFLSEEISVVEKNVEQYKKRNDLIDVNSNAQLYIRTASEYNKELSNNELKLDIINSLEEYLKQEELRLVLSSLNIQDATLNGLLSKFNELQLDRQRMLRTIQPSSSLILNIDDQLANLRVNIQENLKNIKSGLMLTLDNLQSNSAQFQTKIRQVPTIDRELQEINRQQSIKQSIYLFLLQRREETGLALASIEPKSRIIDAPSANNAPFNTNNSTLYLAAIFLGFLIPVAIIYVKDILKDKITDKNEVENVTNVPILGEIYHSETKSALQITEGNHSAIAETFRLARANLHFANVGKENKVILITSSRSGEGKTFFSINLGASLALSGKKVILLEFDLRLPRLLSDLNYNKNIGITNFLVSNNLDLESLVIDIKEIPDLYAIGAGTIPPNPAELMMSSKVKQLIKVLREQYDYIIMDTSPVGQVADAFNLSSYADSTLYVVRYNFSSKSQLPIIEDVYQNQKLKNLMIVLNDGRKKNGSVYGYRYGNGYGTNQIKKGGFFNKMAASMNVKFFG